MNVLSLIAPELSGRICLTLLHSVWQITALAALAWLVSRLWRRQSVEWTYGVYVAALLLSCACVPVTFMLTQAVQGPAQVAMLSDAEPPGMAVEQPVESLAVPLPAQAAIEPVATEHSPASAQAPSLKEEAADGLKWAGVWKRSAPCLAGVYAVGVMLMFVRLAVCIVRAERLRGKSQVLTQGRLVEALRRLSRAWSMRVVPALAMAESIVVPKVVGLLKPTILMPASALSGLSPDELEMILAHELAHVLRYDMWVNLLQRLTEAMLFFNPALWLLSRRISSLREYCCDELTCSALPEAGNESHLRYVRALLQVVELAQSTAAGPSQLAALAASGRSPSELRRRVARLFGEPLSEPLQLSRGSIFALVGVLSLLSATAIWTAKADTAEQASRVQVEADLAHNQQLITELKKHCSAVYEEYGERNGERHLKSLDLWRATDNALRALGNVRGLEELRFTASDLRKPAFAEVGRLTSLKSLTTTNGRLLPSQVKVLEGLANLEHLDLDFSVLEESKDSRSALLGELSESEQQTWDRLANSGKQEHIIQAALLTDRALPSLSKLTKLKTLRLNNTFFTSASLKHLSSLANLEVADIGPVDMSAESVQSLAALKQLHSLRYFNADDALVERLAELSNLETLDIWSGDVTDVGARRLTRLQKLKRLEIRGNQMTDAGLMLLAQLPKLEYLDLRFAKKITAQGIKQFQQVRNACEVESDLVNPPQEYPDADALSVHRPDGSAVWFQSGDHVHFAVYYPGFFQRGLSYEKYSDSQHAPALWRFRGVLTLLGPGKGGDATGNDGHKLPIQFDYSPPSLAVVIGERDYDLTDGRVFVVDDKGTVKQLPIANPTAGAMDGPAALNRLVAQVDEFAKLNAIADHTAVHPVRNPKLAIKIEQDLTTFDADQNITITLTLKNLTSKEMSFPKTYWSATVLLDGKEFKLLPESARDWNGPSIILPDGGEARIMLTLSEYGIGQDVLTPGEHEVAVRIESDVSNVLKFAIREKN